MDASFVTTDEQRELRAVVKDLFARQAASERVRDVMMEGGTDESLWQEVAQLGLVSLPIPEQFGGSGAGFQELAVVVEEAGRRLAPIPLLSSAVLTTITLLAAADASQSATHLPRLASGELRGALAHLDARGRSTAGPGVEAERASDHWKLRGTSGFVIDGATADLLVVAASTKTGMELFLVPADTPGVHREVVPTLDLTRPMAHVTLDVTVDEDAHLAEVPAPIALQRGLWAGAAALACEQVGACDEILSLTTQYAKSRIQFGRPIGSFQAVKHRLAEALVQLESARSTAWHAVRAVALGTAEECEIAVPAAKSLCSEAFERIAADCLQLHGGIGFTWEHDAHLYLKRAKSAKQLLGDPVHHRRLLAAALGLE